MRRRTRSPKGAGGAAGAATGATRGGRGRGRARGGGAKGKTGGRGSGGVVGNKSRSNSPTDNDCVNIIMNHSSSSKDNHRHNSNHFSRQPNGSLSGGSGVLQLGGIPRRPAYSSSSSSGPATNNNNSSNAVNLNNGGPPHPPGSDYYLHKKFKKVTATVDPAPVASSSGGGEPSSSSSSAAASGMVYKPKFRIKSDLEAAASASAVTSEEDSKRVPAPPAQSDAPDTPAVNLSVNKPMVTSLVMPMVAAPLAQMMSSSDIIMSSSRGSGGGVISTNSNSILIGGRYPPASPTRSSSSGSSNSCGPFTSSSSAEPGKLSKELRLDRKSLDDRISKIIDENQSILEWPVQFTKMHKKHTSGGSHHHHHSPQNSHQRTSHLLSGGSTTELPVTSPSSLLSSSPHLSHHHHHPHNGLLRHHSSGSSSDGMPTSGGSVELVNSRNSSPHHHQSTSSLLNSNGLSVAVGRPSPAGSSSSSVLPQDLSFGAHHPPTHHHVTTHHSHHNGSSGGSVITTAVAGCPTPSPSASPVLTSSISATTTTTSSMVPKKRRRLSPTPSRLCGGEVSELPVRDQSGGSGSGGKGYFQDVDMTVRVSNCGPSGAKVTIRTNNGAISGGSVVSAPPVDFTKMIESPSPLMPKHSPNNGAIFFPGPGPSSPVPLSLVSSSKKNRESSLSPSRPPTTEQKPTQKSPRGRPPRKKSVPEVVSSAPVISTSVASASPSSLLRLAVPPPLEIPSRVTTKPMPSPISLLSPALSQSSMSAAAAKTNSPSPPTLLSASKSENSNPVIIKSTTTEPCNNKETPCSSGNSATTPFTIVPTSTPQNPKRPTFLALKPANTNSKKTEPGVLPSPETPRVAKPYNQMTINGQAYTYLGFKVSTRSSYTCLFKTQPMFIPQESDPKLSMYTNWQPRPRDPNQMEIGISTNDSRVNGRRSPHHILYTSAIGKGLDTLTVSSPDNQPPITSPLCESKTFLSGLEQQSKVSATVVSDSVTQPINVQVSPPIPSSKSGIVPISPPSSSTSSAPQLSSSSSSSFFSSSYSPPVSTSTYSTASSSHHHLGGSGGLIMSMSSASPKPIMTTTTSSNSRSQQRKDTGSDTSSAEESSVSGGRRRSTSLGSIGKRYRADSSGRPSQDQEDGDLSNVSSEGPLALTSKGLTMAEKDHRVKIMEGGFESNEDYTYVRGRGRGRYVCEACGIRCKKPSMLRKHLKTHTDLRPYTCKLCNFSFKTKGNLTKHQKSKSHHKKCAGLGIHPESSTSLAMTGPGAFSISDTNTTDDNESDDDMEEDDNGEDMDEGTDSQEEIDAEDDSNTASASEHTSGVGSRLGGGSRIGGTSGGGGSESFEKEIAQSLLDLSKATFQPRIASQGSASVASSSDYESGDGRGGKKRPAYPFNAVIEDISNSSAGSAGGAEPVMGVAAPIDLSVKPVTTTPQQQLFEQSSKRIKLEHKNGIVRTATVVGSAMVVKEAEKWEPPEDEEAMMGITSGGASAGGRCLNLTKVLNNSSAAGILGGEDSSNSEMMVRIPEVKLEVSDYPEPAVTFPSQQQQRQSFAGASSHQRQRTESETSSCSSLGGASSGRNSGRTPPLITSQQQHGSSSTSAGSSSGAKKLHQPWLSPSEPKEKKVEAIEITPINHATAASIAATIASNAASPPPPAIEIRPVNISPPAPATAAAAAAADESNKFKLGMDESSNGGVEISVKELTPGGAPPSSLGDSPHSKLFSELSAAAAALKPQAEFRQPSGPQALVKDEGKAECNVCGKTFARASQLTLHMNIHYIERPFRCDPCGVSFRTKGHLIKHRRSSSHDCKVYLTEAWGVANEENPRPFKCPDCKIAFRIHGHLAKHLRSKMHIMRMECLGKLPFGIYFEMEKSGINLNEIDTTDCDMSLVSLQNVARKIYGDQWRERLTVPVEEPPA